MKKVSLILSVVVLAATVNSCGGSEEENKTTEVIKENEKSEEKPNEELEKNSNELIVGKQVWMKNNLDVKEFKNGDPIPLAKNDEEWIKAIKEKTPSSRYYDDNPENGKLYGMLYNWYAVNDSRGLAPNGWRVPSDKEWSDLAEFIKNSKPNENEFKPALAGCFDGYGFRSIEKSGYWWSSTEHDMENALRWTSDSKYIRFVSVAEYKGYGLSVLCIKD